MALPASTFLTDLVRCNLSRGIKKKKSASTPDGVSLLLRQLQSPMSSRQMGFASPRASLGRRSLADKSPKQLQFFTSHSFAVKKTTQNHKAKRAADARKAADAEFRGTQTQRSVGTAMQAAPAYEDKAANCTHKGNNKNIIAERRRNLLSKTQLGCIPERR